MSIQQSERHLSRVSLSVVGGGRNRKVVYGRKDEEFCADVILIAKRILDARHMQIFNHHYLLGADWTLCVPRLNAKLEPGQELFNRGSFFHAAYRVEQKLGRAFREMQPYGLYPLDSYFKSVNQGHAPSKAESSNSSMPLRAPLKKRPIAILAGMVSE